MEGTEEFPVLCVAKEGKRDIADILARESPLSVILNEPELAALLSTATDLDYLAVGFIASEGLLGSNDEIKRITVDAKNGMVWVETIGDRSQPAETLPTRVIASSDGRGLASATPWRKVESQMNISTDGVLGLVEKFQYRSPIYRATGGTHSAALCDTSDILISAGDIGRHNGLGKALGECIPEDIPTENRVVLTSGRVSSQTSPKVAMRNIPMSVSISAPTNLAV